MDCSREEFAGRVEAEGYKIVQLIPMLYQGWELDEWACLAVKDEEHFYITTSHNGLVVEKDITRKPMVVQMKRLLTIMQELKHPHIDLLKIDIEGCEYVVIDDIVKSGIRPSQFMVEWHPLEGCDKDVFIKKITDCGYVVTRLEGINYTFCKER